MTVQELIKQIRTKPESLQFQQVIATIDANYSYIPTRFTNGAGTQQAVNEAGTNEGSCKVFAFGKINSLSEQETLNCFAEHYRSVLDDPDGDAHANIRNFMQHGWTGISFDGAALSD